VLFSFFGKEWNTLYWFRLEGLGNRGVIKVGMTRLRKSILFIIFYLLVIFNIDKLGYGSAEFLRIAPFVYALVIGAVVATLVLPFLQRHSIYYSIVLWALIYLIIRLVLINHRPLFGGAYIYLTITEISILSIAVVLSYELVHSLHELEEIVANVTMPKGRQRVLAISEAEADIDTEFARSRRYNRPLSVLVVRITPNNNQMDIARVVKDIQQSMLNRYMLASMAQMISKVARRTDLIIEKDTNNSFVLLCPETNTEGVYNLAERLQHMATQYLGIDLRFGVASFPDEALTFDDLLKRAEVQSVTPTALPVYSFLDEEMELEEHRI